MCSYGMATLYTDIKGVSAWLAVSMVLVRAAMPGNVSRSEGHKAYLLTYVLLEEAHLWVLVGARCSAEV